MTHFDERLFALQSQEPLPATQDAAAACEKITYGRACVRAALPAMDSTLSALEDCRDCLIAYRRDFNAAYAHRADKAIADGYAAIARAKAAQNGQEGNQ